MTTATLTKRQHTTTRKPTARKRQSQRQLLASQIVDRHQVGLRPIYRVASGSSKSTYTVTVNTCGCPARIECYHRRGVAKIERAYQLFLEYGELLDTDENFKAFLQDEIADERYRQTHNIFEPVEEWIPEWI